VTPRFVISYITNGQGFAMTVKNVGVVYTNETQLQSPSRTLTMMDVNPFITANDSGSHTSQPVARAASMVRDIHNANARMGYIHGKRCNGAWADGHVSGSDKFVYYDIKRTKTAVETDDSFTAY
jgi:prepilin-type processing-associated H-X9-DG protein